MGLNMATARTAREETCCSKRVKTSPPEPLCQGRLFVGANWKCSIEDAEGADALVAKLNDAWKAHGSPGVEVCVFPPYVFLDRVMSKLHSTTACVGSQNAWDAAAGFSSTGVVSAKMLQSIGCKWVLLGHSDRRNTLGETDSLIAQKVAKCLEAGLSVNLTIGETREVRESVGSDGATKVLLGQLEAAAAGIPRDAWNRIAVAYEPVWAIGEGASPCSPEETQRILAALRAWIGKHAGPSAAANCRLLYTGSVNEANAAEYSKLTEVDGFIVGRAGLDAGKLLSICGTLAGAKAVASKPPEVKSANSDVPSDSKVS
mmetsp:Transcript_30077/g.55575  ORF Transcript_30077/g.55575 Transcript_30077/m.55575 type:complete len:316 (+) Transcript_30077:107-1054(+)